MRAKQVSVYASVWLVLDIRRYHLSAMLAKYHTAIHIIYFSLSMERPPEEEVLTFIKKFFAYQLFVIVRVKLIITPHKSAVKRILEHTYNRLLMRLIAAYCPKSQFFCHTRQICQRVNSACVFIKQLFDNRPHNRVNSSPDFMKLLKPFL